MKPMSIFGLVGVVAVVLVVSLFAQSEGLLPDFRSSSVSGFGDPQNLNFNASDVEFTPWELQTWLSVRNRIVSNITTPDFPDPEHRVHGWYSLRNSSSGDYYQKSMEWLLFWEGRGVDGEWQAVVCIYNRPNSTSQFVMEYSRVTWNSVDVIIDGAVVCSFHRIEAEGQALGYYCHSFNV